MEPGEHVRLRVRGADGERDRSVRIGTERYEKRLTVGLGLWLRPEIDLWPFDGDFSVLGLLEAGHDPTRREPLAAEVLHAKRSDAAPPARPAVRERTWIRVLPLHVGTDKRVVGRR